ncbi:FadR/GntR family transcriptional regulator [Planctomicrobium sp. SH661]|uniref:FadR/GntR family transcriptional regulator n=1 Tax=Planctomicrobium sp. SH661 TaxID=3448124 RepID=UPI003F5C0014
MLKAVGRTKLRDVVANQLKNYIRDSDLKPGDRLPTETELANIFGVSRLSLREATKSLGYLGIVQAKPGLGLTVGSVNWEHVTECIGFHPALQAVSLSELIGSRSVIETGVLHYVSAEMQRDPAIYERLNGINARLRDGRDLQQFITLDIEFHRELVLASGFSPLLPFTDILAVFFQRFRESVVHAEWGAGIASHQLIIDALRDQRVDDAITEMRIHIGSHKARLGIES